MKSITVSFTRVYDSEMEYQHEYSVEVYEEQCDLEDANAIKESAFENLELELGEERTIEAKIDVIWN